MFYTLLQEQQQNRINSWNGDRFICFEADSQAEAIERADWFGIDLGEKYIGGLYGEYNRWSWYATSCNTRQPEIAHYPLEQAHSRSIQGDWTIVYKDGNLKSNLGIALEREVGPYHADEEPYRLLAYTLT